MAASAFLFTLPTLAAEEKPFSITVAPYGWFSGVTGTVGAQGNKTHIDESFLDIADQADQLYGMFGRVEAHYLKFGAYADGGYMQIGVDNVPIPNIPPSTITQHIGLIDFGLMYRVWEKQTEAEENRAKFAVDATVGARYWTMGMEIAPAGVAPVKGGAAWFDPTVGARGTIDVGQHLQFVVGGDVGGFGAASQFTWQAIATVGYAFQIGSVQSAVFAGYKAVGDDYTNGGFTWNTILHGPVLGMSFTF
jgi:hypothetical protein